MLSVDNQTTSIVDLSRNASVISTSSSSSTSTFDQPLRPLRPLRPFSAPRRSASRDPQSPGTPRNSSRPPAFITKELALVDDASLPSDTPPKTTANRSRHNSVVAKSSPSDFTFDHKAPLGEGSYSEVLKGTHNLTGKVYAIKVVDKKLLLRERKANTAHAEKNSLTKLGKKGHPGVIKLHWTFQDEWNLYFVLDLAPNGDLQTRIQRLGSLSLESTRFYMAQVLDGLQWMHMQGVLHRDLKPENILLSSEMRVKITDFGTSKSFDELDPNFRATTWVGTAQYIAPELILDTFTCKSSDIWAFGCMLFQCISGRFPFVAKTQYLMWENVKKLEYEFPDGFSDTAKDLVQHILVLNPEQRLGAGDDSGDIGPSALRAHRFFRDADWEWDTLWSIPVPPLTVGVYPKAPELDSNGNVYDAGAAWEQLVEGDGIPWIHGTEEHGLPLELELVQARLHPDPIVSHELVAKSTSAAKLSQSHLLTLKDKSTSRDSSLHSRSPVRSTLLKKARGSFSTTISTGSSDAGAMNKEQNDLTITRVDSRALVVEPWLRSLLPSEPAILNTPVVPRATLRQRASSILPAVSAIRIPPGPLKRRQLVLTSERILCLKLADGSAPTIKSETLLSSNKISVSRKNEREFSIHADGKSFVYAVEDEALASRWVSQIYEAMDAHRGRRMSRS